MIFRQLQLGQMQNFSYIIGDELTRESAIVDPGWEIDKIQRISRDLRLNITSILITHTHFDHINGVKALANNSNVKVYVHEKEAKVFIELNDKVIPIKDKDIIKIGSLEIKVIHSPGHSNGSVCFLVDKKLITGDTIFVCACGRTDLPGGDTKQLFESLQKIANMLEDIEIYSGHDYGDVPFSTVKYEKENNPYLQCKSFEEFLALRG
ncbi:MAG: MBL fold metallo-hydrolase [Nanoarchaeota archaeon]